MWDEHCADALFTPSRFTVDNINFFIFFKIFLQISGENMWGEHCAAALFTPSCFTMDEIVYFF